MFIYKGSPVPEIDSISSKIKVRDYFRFRGKGIPTEEKGH